MDIVQHMLVADFFNALAAIFKKVGPVVNFANVREQVGDLLTAIVHGVGPAAIGVGLVAGHARVVLGFVLGIALGWDNRLCIVNGFWFGLAQGRCW